MPETEVKQLYTGIIYIYAILKCKYENGKKTVVYTDFSKLLPEMHNASLYSKKTGGFSPPHHTTGITN